MTTPGVGLDAVSRMVAGHDGRRDWLAALDAVGAPTDAVALPAPPAMAQLLGRLGVPAEDIAPAVEAAPSPGRDPELWWVLERCVAMIETNLGTHDDPDPPWPDLPTALGPVGRFFYVAMFLAALPVTRSYHRDHGIDDEVSWPSLSDLGDKMRMYRRAHGTGGLDKQDWLTIHLRGALLALGRLQFAVTTLTADLRVPVLHPEQLTTAPIGLGVHIPATGPLEPGAVDRSLARAGDYFAAHLPGPARIGVCTSWLLDPQLAEYLPAGSNILAFQRRFSPTGDVRPGDADILEFVTGRPDRAPADIGRTTTLERAIGDHLRSGRHWNVCTGWCAL